MTVPAGGQGTGAGVITPPPPVWVVLHTDHWNDPAPTVFADRAGAESFVAGDYVGWADTFKYKLTPLVIAYQSPEGRGPSYTLYSATICDQMTWYPELKRWESEPDAGIEMHWEILEVVRRQETA